MVLYANNAVLLLTVVGKEHYEVFVTEQTAVREQFVTLAVPVDNHSPDMCCNLLLLTRCHSHNQLHNQRDRGTLRAFHCGCAEQKAPLRLFIVYFLW